MFKRILTLAIALFTSTCQVASASTSWTIRDGKIWATSESGEYRQEFMFRCKSDKILLLVRDGDNTPIPQPEGEVSVVFDDEIIREFYATPHPKIWYALEFDKADLVDLSKEGIQMSVEVNEMEFQYGLIGFTAAYDEVCGHGNVEV